MKRIITFAAVALSAAFAFAGYEDWYTPAEDFNTQKADLTFWVGDKNIPMTPLPLEASLTLVEVAVDQAVQASGLSENAKNAFALGKRALSEAMFAQLQSEMNRQKIDSLGASVETIFQLTNADKVDSSGAVISSGKLADGVREKMLAKKNALIGGGGTGGAGGEGGDAKPLQIQVTDFHYDTHEFEQIPMNGNKSKMGLKGYKDLRPIESFPFASGIYLKKGWIPFSEGFASTDPNDLNWYAWGGLDTDVLTVHAGTVSDDGKMTLKDWAGGSGGCQLNLKGLLTDRDSEDYIAARQSHTFLTRFDEGGGKCKLHYLSVGDVIDSITPVPPDEATIETYVKEDGSTNIVLYASYDANDEAAASDTELGFIPYMDGGETLKWAGFSEFFSDKVFDTTSDGRVILNGVSEEGSDKMRVLAVNGSGDEQTVSTIAFDNASVDGSIEDNQVIQMHAFDIAPSPYGGDSEFTFADALTNNSATISGMSIPVRYPNGNKIEIGYVPMGKIAGIPSASVDDKTIEASKDDDAADNDPDKLRIKGAKTATEGQVLKMGEDGEVVWDYAAGAGLDCDVYDLDWFPLYTNIVDGVVRFGLQNWETADNINGVYGKKEDSPVMWRMDDSRSLDCDTIHDTINVAGFTGASNRAIPFKNGTNEDGETVEWLAPPSLNPNGKYLKITGTGDSATLAWGDSQVTPDDYSISTNETGQSGKVSIKGWNGSSAYPSFTSSTTLASSLQSSSTKSFYLVARNNYGSISYIPIGTMSVQSTPHCFQYNESTCRFENLHYLWGRTEKTATDNAGYTYGGTVYLVIQHSTGSGVLQKSSVSNSDTQTCIKIATVSGGKVTMDYTNMPVIPAYE